MSEEILTITDVEQIREIFYKYFLKGDVYLKTKNGDLKIYFLGVSENKVAFKIPYIKSFSGIGLVFARRGHSIIYIQLKFLDKSEDESFIFHPIKLQIINVQRKEERLVISPQSQSKKIVYVTNIISDFIMENTLSMEIKKIDRIKEILKSDIEGHFPYIKIFFFNEGRSDPRMKYFLLGNKPLHIYDMRKKPSTEREMTDYTIYMNEIYAKDYYLQNRKQLISEISVPFLFRTKIPYGYIQVNSTAPIPENILSIIKKIAISGDEMLTKMRFFPVSNDKLLVSDISRNGLSMAFRDRKFIRYFKERCRVYFDLMLPNGKKASIQAEVRNIVLLENKIIKVGCEIKEMDALSEVNYEEFLEESSKENIPQSTE
ncbi:MAG: hypothetical protein N2316_01770 [Spirochaetes bacterium]|nr:hypothetical protein [Spirochaetota bacterium]